MVMEILGAKLLYPTAILIVAGVGVAVTLASSLIHRKTQSRQKMDDVRARMEKHQKEMLAAQDSGDKKKIKKLEAEQAEIMKAVKDNMMASLKPSLMTMPVVLILIWVLSSTYGPLGPLLDLPIGIPFLTAPVMEAGVANGVTWFGLYLVSAISSALFAEMVLRRILKV